MAEWFRFDHLIGDSIEGVGLLSQCAMRAWVRNSLVERNSHFRRIKHCTEDRFFSYSLPYTIHLYTQ